MSVWNDIRKESSSEIIKMEDKINFITPEGLSPVELERMLKNGIVHFIFKKKPLKGQTEDSGATREAWGTKNMDIVDKIPHGGGCPPKELGYTTYFDLEKSDWRVYLDNRLVGTWDYIYSLEEFKKIHSK